jgi:aspartate aminotransferase-like enzyme
MVIYTGKLLAAECFRIGSIGHLFLEDVWALLETVARVTRDMGMRPGSRPLPDSIWR